MKMARISWFRFWCWFSALELDLDSRSITFSVSTTSFLFWEQICLASMRAALVKSNQIKTHFLVLRHCKIKNKHQNKRNHFKPDTWEPTMISQGPQLPEASGLGNLTNNDRQEIYETWKRWETWVRGRPLGPGLADWLDDGPPPHTWTKIVNFCFSWV